MRVKSESEVAQSCLTLSDPMNCSPLGSSVHGICQARVLEWGAIAFSALALKVEHLDLGCLKPPHRGVSFPINCRGCGTSLVVQWLRLHASVTGGLVQPLVRQLRSHMPGAAEKKKKCRSCEACPMKEPMSMPLDLGRDHQRPPGVLANAFPSHLLLHVLCHHSVVEETSPSSTTIATSTAMPTPTREIQVLSIECLIPSITFIFSLNHHNHTR